METFLFYTQFSPLNAGNHLLGLCNLKLFWGSMPPDTPWKRGLLIQSVTLFRSAGYFNFYWNPWHTVLVRSEFKRSAIALDLLFEDLSCTSRSDNSLGQLLGSLEFNSSAINQLVHLQLVTIHIRTIISIVSSSLSLARTHKDWIRAERTWRLSCPFT